ncbi:MAG: Ldh family oxidoreductase [Chloroflexi bacterium]|nr:Ldh family oxidoreductase [Chloroflexota bacterium]
MIFDFLNIQPDNARYFPAERLQLFATSILQALNVPEEHARISADALVSANLRGVDTHGIINLLEYTPMILDGSYTIPQEIRVIRESESTALMSNGNGLGFVGGVYAMRLAIQKAWETGSGQVVICDGRHIGMAAYFSMMALEHDMIGITYTNGSRSVRPILGARTRLGTNPLAFAAPAGKQRPFVLDMATSTVAGRKIELAHNLGVPIPEGWAVDYKGHPITKPPLKRSDAWAQNPLGNTLVQGGHKGYGLAVMIDIMTGVLSGGGYGANMSFGQNYTWVMALDISRIRPVDEFKQMMDDMIIELHSTPPEEGAEQVLVAGDPEADTQVLRMKTGVPFHYDQVKKLNELAASLKVDGLH